MSQEQGKPGELSSGFGVVTIGDESYAAQPTDEQILTTHALTAARTITLPAAASVPIGSPPLLVLDLAGVVGSTDTLSIARNGSDTINGGSSPVVLNAANATKRCFSNGVNGWAIV